MTSMVMEAQLKDLVKQAREDQRKFNQSVDLTSRAQGYRC